MKIFVFASIRGSTNSFRPEREIFEGLARKGHDVTLMTRGSEEQLAILKKAGIRVIDGEASKKICLESIKTIRKELKHNHYDIVYATNSKTIPNAGFACIGLKVKFVVYRGTTGGLYRHDPTAYLTILHPRVDGVVCVSEAVRQDVLKQVWKNKQKVVKIYKGHNLHWYKDKPTADLSEFGIKKGDYTVICAVNARPSKGIAVMLEASNYLADIGNLHLLLVGRGMDKNPYTDLINNSKMSERIHLTGYRYDAPSLTKASDVLVQPSISGEGLPRAVMEAMGIGTAVVITPTGGGKEIIEDGESGFIVPIKDPKAIASKVRELYHNPQLAKKMVDINLAKIAGELSSETTVENYISYFEKLVSAND
ncbi:MAG: glycosyl transferase family 1 [Gammaproteobacteria bacterium]|nr:MAG: glycosyl transferase family 1 [Gammaproteobacteria bacterium]